jgi:hypothetical protein
MITKLQLNLSERLSTLTKPIRDINQQMEHFANQINKPFVRYQSLTESLKGTPTPDTTQLLESPDTTQLLLDISNLRPLSRTHITPIQNDILKQIHSVDLIIELCDRFGADRAALIAVLLDSNSSVDDIKNI